MLSPGFFKAAYKAFDSSIDDLGRKFGHQLAKGQDAFEPVVDSTLKGIVHAGKATGDVAAASAVVAAQAAGLAVGTAGAVTAVAAKGAGRVAHKGLDLTMRAGVHAVSDTVQAGIEVGEFGHQAIRATGRTAAKYLTNPIDAEDINDIGELIMKRRLRGDAMALSFVGAYAVGVGSGRRHVERREEVGEVGETRGQFGMLNQPVTQSLPDNNKVKSVMRNGAEGDIVFALHNRR